MKKKVFTILDKGFQFLLKGSIVNNNGQRYWPMSVTDKSYRYWWCHGSPGISLALLKLYESTRDIWEADIAKSALDGIPKQALSPSPSMNLSICHGLAGLGEIYLTAFQILKDRVWYERASEIATIIRLLSKDHHKYGITFYGEPQNPAIALWTGHLGVVHFLLRYSQKGLGRFPLLI